MHGASRLAAYFVFLLAPLPFGSTDLLWICLWTLLLAFSLLTSDLSKVGRAHLRLLLPLFVTLALIAGVVAIQTWPDPSVGQADQAWPSARNLLGLSLPDRISLTANEPWLAFGYPLLFSLAVTRAVMLAADAVAARQLVRILAWTGFCYALYGILAETLDPEALLFRHKEAYLGVATGTFVNRNTAATFWGSSALLFLVPLLRALHRRDWSKSLDARPFARLSRYLSSMPALLTGFSVCTLATAMTSSRAGLLISIFAYLLAGALYLTPLRLQGPRRWGLATGALAAAALLLELFGGLVNGRIAAYGLVDQGRVWAYRSSITAIRDHPLLGTGLGSFEAAFPPYRAAELGSLGIWDRAHSTPLEFAVELGLPAAAVVVVVALWYGYKLLYGSLLRRRDRYLPIAGASVGLLGVLHSCVDFSLQIPGYGLFFAAVVGCGLAQCIASSEKSLLD